MGPQHWWPAGSAFEVVVGAYLTQNTAWRNVELAMENLRGAGVLSVSGNPRGQRWKSWRRWCVRQGTSGRRRRG